MKRLGSSSWSTCAVTGTSASPLSACASAVMLLTWRAAFGNFGRAVISSQPHKQTTAASNHQRFLFRHHHLFLRASSSRPPSSAVSCATCAIQSPSQTLVLPPSLDLNLIFSLTSWPTSTNLLLATKVRCSIISSYMCISTDIVFQMIVVMNAVIDLPHLVATERSATAAAPPTAATDREYYQTRHL